MLESKRSKILKAVVTALQAIKLSNGYPMQVAEEDITRVLGDFLTTDRFPALRVVVGPETVVEQPVAFTVMTIQITVKALLKVDQWDRLDAVEDALASVRKAMVADPQLGGLARDIQYTGASEPLVVDIEKMRAGISASFNVFYKTAWEDPSA